MRTIRSVVELRAALAEPRRAGATIGLVPTMGALHDGHLSLIRQARSGCEVVVVSLFVNPTQFDDASDLEQYPRDEARDATLARSAGADLLFAPPSQEVYPAGFSTVVSVSGLTETLEGAHRGRGHFDGVTTVVTKLFNMVAPDVAYFGQKDAQQVAVIRRLVAELDFPVRIAVCPTVREPDGLAMSSRNVRLSVEERRSAGSLSRALSCAAATVAAGETASERVRAAAVEQLADGIELDYLQIVDPDSLQPITRVEDHALVLLAARIGATRLIDNRLVAIT